MQFLMLSSDWIFGNHFLKQIFLVQQLVIKCFPATKHVLSLLRKQATATLLHFGFAAQIAACSPFTHPFTNEIGWRSEVFYQMDGYRLSLLHVWGWEVFRTRGDVWQWCLCLLTGWTAVPDPHARQSILGRLLSKWAHATAAVKRVADDATTPCRLISPSRRTKSKHSLWIHRRQWQRGGDWRRPASQGVGPLRRSESIRHTVNTGNQSHPAST